MNVLSVGDSWGSGYVLNQGDVGWPTLMGIPAPLQQAVDGSTALQWAQDFDGRLSRAKGTQADAVVLSLLGNDAFALKNKISALMPSTMTILMLGGKDKILAGIIQECHSVLAHIAGLKQVIHTLRREKTLVIQYADPYFGSQPLVTEAVKLINESIELAVPDGVMMLPTGRFLTPECFDGVDYHANMLGQQLLAAKIKEALES